MAHVMTNPYGLFWQWPQNSLEYLSPLSSGDFPARPHLSQLSKYFIFLTKESTANERQSKNSLTITQKLILINQIISAIRKA